LFGHQTEEDITVAHGEGVGVFEIELKLRVRILVVERVEVPTEAVDAGGHFVEPGVAVHEALHVVTGFDQIVVRVGNLERAVFGVFDDVELALDAEVHAKAHFRGGGELFLERDAGGDFVGFALEGVVGGEPGDFLVPRQHATALEVGQGVDFIVVGLLAETIEGITGVKFRARGEVLEVIDGHEFAFWHPVDIDVGADTIFDALAFEGIAECLDLFLVHKF